MLFKNEMADLIEQDKKTATRRLSTKKFYKVNSTQPVQRNYYDKAKTHIHILKRYPQKLRDMTDADAVAEGFESLAYYYLYLININKSSLKKLGIVPLDGPNKLHLTDAFLNLEPTVYEFERIGKAVSSRCNECNLDFCGNPCPHGSIKFNSENLQK